MQDAPIHASDEGESMETMHAELSASTQRCFGKPLTQMVAESPDAVAVCSDSPPERATTKTAGTRHRAPKFRATWKSAVEVAACPQSATATSPRPASRMARATPTACTSWLPAGVETDTRLRLRTAR